MSSQPRSPQLRGPLRRAGHDAAERLRRARRALAPPAPRVPARAQTAARRGPRSRALVWTGSLLAILAIGVAAFLAIFDWNWFRGPVGRYASARMHRQVTLQDLDVHLFSWRPSAVLSGVRVANPRWAGPSRMAEIERLRIQIRLAPLFLGRVDIQLLDVTRPRAALVRDGQGRANWDFSDGRARQAPLRLPPIRRFLIQDGRVSLDDAQRKLRFTGVINASETLGARNRGFELTGEGSLNRAPFLMEVTGGPLLNIRRDQPYPFDAQVRAGATRVWARGAVPKPFDLGRLDVNFTAQGDDLADLYDLTGAALPNTPPYRLSGHLIRDGQIYRINDLKGRVGDSDLAGRMTMDRGRERPLLTATLRSRSLDFDDLAAVFGGAPKAGPGETASPTQKAVGQAMAARRRFLPDATLKGERLRAMDAEVDYRAADIRDAPLPLRSGSVKLDLDRGLLVADPVAMNLSRGSLAGWVKLNARQATPVTSLDLRLTGARLEQLVPARGGARPLAGTLVARARLTGVGDSVHRAASAADGEVVVAVPDGEIRKAFAELMGINVVRGLGLLLSKDQSTTPVRCAVASFQARDGVLSASNIVFDTGPVLGTGSGTLNLGDETLDMRLKGHPKKARLIRLMAPITVKGPMTGPKVGVDAGGAVAQGGAAAALAALVSPLAAVLPFVDLGQAKDAPCGALIAEARSQGAPLRTAAR